MGLHLALHLHAMVHNMWKTRNETIHKVETSAINTERNRDLDQQIDALYTDLPQLLLFPPSDRAVFKRKKERIKKYRIINKENWVTTAKRVKEAYFHSLTPAATAFLDFFGIRHQRRNGVTSFLASQDTRVRVLAWRLLMCKSYFSTLKPHRRCT